MRLVVILLALLAVACGERGGGPYVAPGRQSLTIYSTTDTAVFLPVIDDFRRVNPNIEVDYVELEAAPLNARFLAEAAAGKPRADLLLSSAMDLQVKLVNDGFAQRHMSQNAAALPRWARWRDEAFGFTFEPVVMVYNRALMAGHEVPHSRPELLNALREAPSFWDGRIGTYDVVNSSVGYLIASQDSRNSSDFGALIEAFRDANVEMHSTTSTLLDRIEAGKLLMGYNLFGSYAQARARVQPVLAIVYPEDYTLAVSRTAVIPQNAPNSAAAHVFLEYLLSLRGQQVLTERSMLSAVRAGTQADALASNGLGSRVEPLRPIPLGPGLLVYLDGQKKERLLELWGGPKKDPRVR